MNVISIEDINYLSQQSSGKINMILSGMTSLMNDTDNKVSAMESQNWFMRMVKTVFGKNKATQQEIQQNHEKLNAYMAEAVAELYNRNCIDEKVMMSLGMQMNEIYADQVQLKQMLGAFVTKLNEKIDSIDNFHMLVTEIEQGVYSDCKPIVSVCSVLSQFDSRTLQDKRKLEILERSLTQGNILSENECSLYNYLLDMMEVPVENIGELALELGTIRSNYFAEILLNVVENYHFLPDLKRKMKDKNLIIQDILEEHGISDDVVLSISEIYSDLLQSKIETSANRPILVAPTPVLTETIANTPQIASSVQQSHESPVIASTEVISAPAVPHVTTSPKIQSTEKEEIHIRSKISLNSGEIKEFSRQIIHFHAPITGKGVVKFTECVIYYAGISHSRDSFDKWVEAKEIYLADCKVEGISYDEQASFLNAANIGITNSEILNCSNFIACHSPYDESGKTQLINCSIVNPGQNFLNGDYVDNIFENCLFTYHNIPEFINYQKCCLSAGNLTLKQCTFSGRPPKNDDDRYHYNAFIEVKNLHLSNCQITNFGSFFLSPSPYGTHSFEIDWCVFENCSKILSCRYDYKASVSHCQFNHCHKTLFAFNEGTSVISECEFNDWHGDESVIRDTLHEQWKGIGTSSDTLIKFDKHDTCSNSIKKCTFNNAVAYYDFLIATGIYQNTNAYVVWVTDCVFNNCITERSSGKLIKHYASYRNIFNKEKQVQTINSDNGKYTSDKVSYTIMETTPLGEKIGCTLHADTVVPSGQKAVPAETPSSTVNTSAPIMSSKNAEPETKLSALDTRSLAYGAIYYYLTQDYNKMITLPLYSGKQLSTPLANELVKLQQMSPMLLDDLKVYFTGLTKECAKALLKQVVSLLESQSAVSEAMKWKIKCLEDYIATIKTTV